MQFQLTLVTGGFPVPREIITVGLTHSSDLPRTLSDVLYSVISVSTSRVGLLDIKPPSMNRPCALVQAKILSNIQTMSVQYYTVKLQIK